MLGSAFQVDFQRNVIIFNYFLSSIKKSYSTCCLVTNKAIPMMSTGKTWHWCHWIVWELGFLLKELRFKGCTVTFLLQGQDSVSPLSKNCEQGKFTCVPPPLSRKCPTRLPVTAPLIGFVVHQCQCVLCRVSHTLPCRYVVTIRAKPLLSQI